MKRYLLFVGENYYAIGGMEDFVADFDTVNDAMQYINPAEDYLQQKPYSFGRKVKPVLERKPRVFKKMNGDRWAHIYDTENREIVFKTYND